MQRRIVFSVAVLLLLGAALAVFSAQRASPDPRPAAERLGGRCFPGRGQESGVVG